MCANLLESRNSKGLSEFLLWSVLRCMVVVTHFRMVIRKRKNICITLILMVKNIRYSTWIIKRIFCAQTVIECLFAKLFLGAITDAKEKFVGGKHRANRRF